MDTSQRFRVGVAIGAIALIAGCGGGSSIPLSGARGTQSLAQSVGSLRTEQITRDAKGNSSIQVPYNVGTQPSRVTFVTMPNAVCQRASDTTANPWTISADSSGGASFNFSIADSNAHQDALSCSAEGTKQTVSIAYVRSTVQLAPAVSLPVPIPSESQMQSVAAELGFDPRTADNSVLIAHNLPPRAPDFATNPEASVGWLKAVFSPTTSLITNANQSTNVPGVYNTAMALSSGPVYDGALQTVGTGNWSGYDDAGVQGTYNTVRGYWTVPTLRASSANPAYSSIWVGIDGGVCADTCNDTVFQDGTAQDFSSSGGVNYFSYEGWWEYYPSNTQQNLFAVSPGDEMYGTFWKNAQSGQVYGQYYLKDITTGATANFAIVVGAALKGDSVEWIAEAPSIGGSTTALADYGSTTMSQDELITGSSTIWYDQIYNVSSYSTYQVELTRNGNLDSIGTDPNPDTGGMTLTWYNSN